MREIKLAVKDLEIAVTATDARILHGISFEVAAGKILGLVGESGSGKTTAGLAILGYVRRGLAIAGGSVNIEGIELIGASPAQLRDYRGRIVAYVPQDPSSALNPGMRVYAQLAEMFTTHRPTMSRTDIRASIADLLEQVHLSEISNITEVYPHQLSGGQQQRIGIAMAFACEPSVIILDEPTTGLDVSTQSHIIEMVRELCRAHGTAAVYVSHDLAVIRQLADDVAVMLDGNIVEYSDTESLFIEPKNSYTRKLLDAAPSPDKVAPKLEFAESDSDTGAAARAVSGRSGDAPLRQVLQINQVNAGYGTKQVLQDVSLSVASRECVAVVGESGSGKTTLARCVIGLHTGPRTGEILFSGAPLDPRARGRDKEQRRRIQYIFQNPYGSLNPRRTIGESLLVPLQLLAPLPTAQAWDKAVAALEDVSMGSEYLTRYPDELSGGQRQRIAIARALVVDPELLVCDEVTSALDVSVQAVVIDTLRSLQLRRNLSMLFITHNIALVRSIAQRVVVLSNGQVVEDGETESIMTNPQHSYTQSLLNDVPRLERRQEAKNPRS